MKPPQKTADWALMIDQLLRKGLTLRAIGRAMSCDLTDRMLSHYRMGVQPTWFRGQALIVLWCDTLEAKADTIPMTEVVRGHRVAVNRQPATAPQVVNLPAWPPGQLLKPADKPKRKKQRGAISIEVAA